MIVYGSFDILFEEGESEYELISSSEMGKEIYLGL